MILCEEIFSDFEMNQMIETSFLQQEEKLYFWKRIFNLESGMIGENINDSEEGTPASMRESNVTSDLRLYCFDVTSNKSEQLQFSLPEHGDTQYHITFSV